MAASIPHSRQRDLPSRAFALDARDATGSTGRCLDLSPRAVATAFAAIVGLLLLSHVLVQILGRALGDDQLLGLLPLLNVGTERNLPTFYSASTMLLCSGLLLLLVRLEWRAPGAARLFWAGLAAVFFALACDEMLVLHEKLIEPVRSALGTSGVLYYAWVIPYGAFALAFAGAYSRFLWRLPRRTAGLLVLSGAVFVSGALGLEMAGGYWRESYGHDGVYVALQTIEEALEMSGIVLFLYSLLDYMAREHDLRLHLEVD
jgi:hypothetical protein